MSDHYATLGLRSDAKLADIKKAFRQLAALHHPDRNPAPDAAARFRAVQQAYEAKLIDVEDRLKEFRIRNFGVSGVSNQDYFSRISVLTEQVNKLRGATRRTSQLANQLLALSRADARAMHSQPMQRVQLKDLCEAILETHLDAATAKRIDLGLDAQPAQAVGHEWLLRELLGNLVDNAVKYTPEGGTVTIRCGLRGDVQAVAKLRLAERGADVGVVEIGVGEEADGFRFEILRAPGFIVIADAVVADGGEQLRHGAGGGDGVDLGEAGAGFVGGEHEFVGDGFELLHQVRRAGDLCFEMEAGDMVDEAFEADDGGGAGGGGAELDRVVGLDFHGARPPSPGGCL